MVGVPLLMAPRTSCSLSNIVQDCPILLHNVLTMLHIYSLPPICHLACMQCGLSTLHVYLRCLGGAPLQEAEHHFHEILPGNRLRLPSIVCLLACTEAKRSQATEEGRWDEKEGGEAPIEMGRRALAAGAASKLESKLRRGGQGEELRNKEGPRFGELFSHI